MSRRPGQYERTPEIKEKTRVSLRTTHVNDPELRYRTVEARRVNGKPWTSAEARQRLSEAGRGRTHSEETKAKIGAAHRGKPNPGAAANLPKGGHAHSEAAKEKIGAAQRGVPRPYARRKHPADCNHCAAIRGNKFREGVRLSPEHAEALRASRPESFRPSALENTLVGMFPEGERELRAKSFWIDVALPELMIALEADGAHWHDPFFSNPKDTSRDLELADEGWFVFRFSENFLRKVGG